MQARRFGHKWQFKYDAAAQSATLLVAIVDYDGDTGKLLNIQHEETHALKQSGGRGGAVVVELPIKPLIEETYAKLRRRITYAIDDVERYLGFYVEANGRWQLGASGIAKQALVQHPSLGFALAPAKERQRVTFATSLQDGANNNLRRGGESGELLVQDDTNARLYSHFLRNPNERTFHGSRDKDFEQRTYLMHGAWTKTGIDLLGVKTFREGKRAHFDIRPAELVITPHPQFELHSFIIDPVASGHGDG